LTRQVALTTVLHYRADCDGTVTSWTSFKADSDLCVADKTTKLYFLFLCSQVETSSFSTRQLSLRIWLRVNVLPSQVLVWLLPWCCILSIYFSVCVSCLVILYYLVQHRQTPTSSKRAGQDSHQHEDQSTHPSRSLATPRLPISYRIDYKVAMLDHKICSTARPSYLTSYSLSTHQPDTLVHSLFSMFFKPFSLKTLSISLWLWTAIVCCVLNTILCSYLKKSCK